jgi:hypothetical protein
LQIYGIVAELGWSGAFAGPKNGLHFLLLRTILARTSRRWQPPRSPASWNS